ncbi:MAG: biopolymer transporter ExbD [Bacteroidota bacterium]|jgi:biopolymer transport protein ExbD|nr:biopolymer transporter ExbD [Bacteroidota bacterium]MDP3915337.1 biopolymer transporter ExbD [Bacteroidota bacterium]
MALKRRNKVNVTFSMASMTDIVFLLLLFFMITSTMVAPNALKLLLPQSNNQTVAKAITTVSITADLKYYINEDGDLKRVSFSEIEPHLQQMIKENEETYIALHADKSVPIEQVVSIMNIAKRNNIKMILATAAEE